MPCYLTYFSAASRIVAGVEPHASGPAYDDFSRQTCTVLPPHRLIKAGNPNRAGPREYRRGMAAVVRGPFWTPRTAIKPAAAALPRLGRTHRV